MTQPTVTIAVTAYKRPKMTEDVIKSYLNQGYKSSELLIVDDCVEDVEVEKIVKKYQLIDSRIRYIKNSTNLGYCKNFLKSLQESKGKYIITLGDDDIFLSSSSVKKYVDVFEAYPEVGHVHTNTIQFNQNYEMDYAYRTYQKDTLYSSTYESLVHTWIQSIHIAGIGLRNNINFTELYPKNYLLFPQVELIGKLLGLCKSFGIVEYTIGVRAHSNQLGFYAAKGQRIKKEEKFSPSELYVIFDNICAFYKADLHIEVPISKKDIDTKLVSFFTTILPTEKINSGNIAIIKTFLFSFKFSIPLQTSLRFCFYFIVSLILPSKILFKIKEFRKKQIRESKFKSEKLYFDSEVAALGLDS